MKKNYILSVLFFLFLGIAANAQNFPVATDDVANTMESTPVTIDFLQNDTFGEDGPNTDPVSIISNPLHGEVQLFNSPIPNGPVVWSITYTPFLGFVGVDSFLYTLKDANGDASTATITIVVQSIYEAPIATNDFATTNENTSVTINVLANDSFGNYGPNAGSILLNSNPLNGTALVNPNGTPTDPTDDTIIYVPNQNFIGQDFFTYAITDAFGDSSTATVNINVLGNPNEPNTPTAENDYVSTEVNTAITINALANDYFGVDGPAFGSITLISSPSNGSVVVNTNGTPNDQTDDTFTYVPNAGYYGNDNFTYTISDATGDTSTATVNIIVLQSPNGQYFPLAANDNVDCNFDTTITINVLANDSFGNDGPGLGAIAIIAQPLNGTVLVNNNGTPNDPTDDTLVYTPNTNYFGIETILYSISDANLDSSIATVYINLLPNPNEPAGLIAADDFVNYESSSATVVINALANDNLGVDSANFASILVTAAPYSGTVSVNDNGTPNDPTDDFFVYHPGLSYINDVFTYSIFDSNGNNSSATVYIYAGGTNNQPILFEKTAVVQGNGNVGDAIVYTFKITNITGGTMSSISIYDQMLSPTSIHDIGGLAPGDMDIFNYTYIITQNDLNIGSVINSAMIFYTDFNSNGVSAFSDDGDLSNGNDNPTVTTLYNFPSVVLDVIQPSCAETTGSILLSNLPSNWILYYNNSSIESNYTTYTIANLPIGAYDCTLIDLNNGLTQAFFVNIEQSVNINAGVTSTYMDYNNDGFTNVGDVINYQYNATNNGSCDLTNIGIYSTPFLNADGATIPILTPQTTDNTTLFATHVITQQEINAGFVHLDNGLFYTAGASTYGIDVIHDTILTITNGFKLNAFIDSNNNAVQDNNEPNFGDGYFTYQLNNGTINNIYSQNGSYYIYEVDPNNLYNITYVLNNQYNQCGTQYVLLTSAFTNLAISNNGIQTLNFAISDGSCTDLAVFMNNGWFSPRPGFNYNNVIYYSNYGNQTIPSGTITFTKDALLSITNVSESAIINNANGFSYNFTNLLPHETRYIYVDMLVPLIPNINLGDVVTNTVTASTSVTENSLSNNVSTITDIVIGSYDPNDKNESHGGKVLHSGFTANDYLTYTIRFENTGTAEAINVKVTDVLDQKLDETSVRMVAASDDYVLDRIGSDLTWTFSGINLVPSVENTQIGHGYLTFQVKPKAGYLLGDVIPNTANIYFDFNPAIVTNECTTEFVSTLAVKNFSENDFSVYPNPTKNILNISAKNNANTIENIMVYDVVGKAILTQKANTPATTIDLSNFTKGVYFVKVSGNGFEKMLKVLRE